jgi:gamma-glutamyltranspeptidase/glutathione hydrolase
MLSLVPRQSGSMKQFSPSRREFLQQGSAALLFGGTLGAGRAILADTTASAGDGGEPRQAIACSRKEAAEAARDVLRQGGNAIDAGVAALLVQCVIVPWNVGLGGYGGSLTLYHAQSGRVHTIDFDSRAPRKFDPATFNETSGRTGYLAVGTPGVVAGIDLALQEYGTLPFKTLAQHALALAENGISVTPRLASSFEQLKNMDEASRRAYFPKGVPAKGDTWVQADLARLIRRLGDEGPGSFYTGEIAATIARGVQAGGGVLAEEDFRDFRAAVVEPLHINYRGYDLYTPPLPSGGLTSLTILKTLEQFNLSKLTPWGARYIELFAGASNLAWEERFQYFGDPDFVKVPVEDLLSEKRAVARAQILRQGMPTTKAQPVEPSHTVNLVVCDREQNVVSWTATHGADYGAQVAIEGLGLMLGHGMSRFAFQSGDPNYPAAGKRPQHNMAPLVVLQAGKPIAGLGLPGGRMIVSVTAQLAVNLIDFKAAPQQVVSAPRIHTEGEEPIQVTSDTPETVVEELRRKGHQVKVQGSIGAGANAVVLHAMTGRVQAAASGDAGGALAF